MRAFIVLAATAALFFTDSLTRAQAPPVVEARQAQGMVFLTKIRLADPNYDTILMACLKENELNLLLSSRFPPEQIATLVKGLAGQLRQAFPGQNLRVVAFRPVVPLHEAGVAEIEGATGTIRYTDAQDRSSSQP